MAAATLVLGSSGLAFADTVVVSPDVTRAPGETATFVVGLVVNDNNTDPVSGCNANPQNLVTVQFASNKTDIVAAPTSVQLTGCDNSATPNIVEGAATVTYTVSASAKDGDTATITASASGGRQGGGNPKVYGTFNPDSITISVATPLPSDSTAPVITPIVTGTQGQSGWYTSDVSVTWSVSDDEGPITSSTGCGPTTVSTDSEGRTLTCTATSAGGTSTKSVTIKRDATAPTVRCAAADGAWHPDNVSLGCTASDGGSGIADADKAFSLATSVAGGEETSNASTGSRTVTDAAGNSASAGPIAGNKVDRKAPEVSCGSDDGSWHAGNIDLACTAKDGGSGLANSSDAAFTLSTNVAAGTETDSASTGSRKVSDAVGNTATVDAVTGIKVDRKAPVVTCAPVDDKWHKGDVTLLCTAGDNGSGLADDADGSFILSTNVAEGQETGNAATDSREVSDKVGNSVTVGPISGNKVDKKAPRLSCGKDDGTWHADNVDIACTGEDGGSGLADAADAAFTLSTTVVDGEETDNASTGSHDVADVVGNTSTAGPISGIKVDRKAPEVGCDPVDDDWHANNVTIGCTATDGGSGLADQADESFTLSTTVADGEETANASTGAHTVADNVGNSTPGGPVTGVKVDRKAPSFSCDPVTAGWHKDNVTIKCTASDGGSGLKNAADASFTLSTDVADGAETDKASTGSRVVTDAVGNSVTVGPFVGIKVDRKLPTVTCGEADGDWHKANVMIACTASDGGSGLENEADGKFTLSTAVADGVETADATTGTYDVRDAAGNVVTAGPVGGNKVDRKAPELNCLPAGDKWQKADVVLECTAADGGSGLADKADESFTLSTTVAYGEETANASTGDHVVADAVGNTDTAGPYAGLKVDKKAPQLSCDPDDGTWHAANVSIACTGKDGGSGLADSADGSFTLSTTVADGEETANASTGSHDVSDVVGNTSTAGPISGIKVDRKAPSITWSAGARDFYFGDQVSAPTCTAVDGGSGVKGECTVSGWSTEVGTHTITAKATDNVGNVGTATLTYIVRAWMIDGFYRPVDMSGVVNTVKAGSTVPLKFNVYKGADPMTANIGATFAVSPRSCTTGAVTDAIEEFSTTGSTSLRYDSTGRQWIQNWATPKTSVGSCFRVTMKTADGTSIWADFKLTK